MAYTDRLTADKSMTFEEFTDMLLSLLKAAWGEEWGVFTDSQPTHIESARDIVFPQIVYQLDAMQPGLVGKNTIEIKPRIRDEISTEDGLLYRVKGQTMDCVCYFYIYGTDNAEAEKTTRDFMDLVDTYKGFLKQNGLKDIYFKTYRKIREASTSKETVSIRRLEYLIRIENVSAVPVDTIKDIQLRAKTFYEEFTQKRIDYPKSTSN